MVHNPMQSTFIYQYTNCFVTHVGRVDTSHPHTVVCAQTSRSVSVPGPSGNVSQCSVTSPSHPRKQQWPMQPRGVNLDQFPRPTSGQRARSTMRTRRKRNPQPHQLPANSIYHSSQLINWSWMAPGWLFQSVRKNCRPGRKWLTPLISA